MNIIVTRTGPLPPVDELVAYDEAYPGFAERFMQLAEARTTRTARFREQMLDYQFQVAGAEIKYRARGQWFTLGLSVTAMATATGFFLAGHNLAGLAFLSLPVVVMVTSFIRR